MAEKTIDELAEEAVKFKDLSEDDLMITLGAQLTAHQDESEATDLMEFSLPGTDFLKKKAQAFLDKWGPKIKPAVCDVEKGEPKEWIETLLGGDDLKEVLTSFATVIIGAIGASIAPAIAVLVALILMRMGVKIYCAKPQPS